MIRPTVLAYHFPDWHPDSRNSTWFGEGWTEWELTKRATPRFPGHRQPRIPALGYRDESDPTVAAAEIDVAADHGVDGFLFDYYWYDDGPYLSGALDDGFLKATNSERMKFALMWANHHLGDIFPHPGPNAEAKRLKNGDIDRIAFNAMTDHAIGTYFSRSNHLAIDGKPWFTIYDLANFIQGMGGLEGAQEALSDFRRRTEAAGFPGLHLDAVIWGFAVLPAGVSVSDPQELVAKLGFDSATSYVWMHHVDVDRSAFPHGSNSDLRESAFRDYEKFARTLDIPVYPNVSVGWDSSPRTPQDREYVHAGYPWLPVWDQTPGEFELGLRQAAQFLDEHSPENPILTINAWNEWTEGSYLLPDTTHGMDFLEALKRVFPLAPARPTAPGRS